MSLFLSSGSLLGLKNLFAKEKKLICIFLTLLSIFKICDNELLEKRYKQVLFFLFTKLKMSERECRIYNEKEEETNKDTEKEMALETCDFFMTEQQYQENGLLEEMNSFYSDNEIDEIPGPSLPLYYCDNCGKVPSLKLCSFEPLRFEEYCEDCNSRSIKKLEEIMTYYYQTNKNKINYGNCEFNKNDKNKAEFFCNNCKLHFCSECFGLDSHICKSKGTTLSSFAVSKENIDREVTRIYVLLDEVKGMAKKIKKVIANIKTATQFFHGHYFKDNYYSVKNTRDSLKMSLFTIEKLKKGVGEALKSCYTISEKDDIVQKESKKEQNKTMREHSKILMEPELKIEKNLMIYNSLRPKKEVKL